MYYTSLDPFLGEGESASNINTNYDSGSILSPYKHNNHHENSHKVKQYVDDSFENVFLPHDEGFSNVYAK